jgi:hypothetical protein
LQAACLVSTHFIFLQLLSWGFVSFGGVAYVAGGKFCAGFAFSQSPLPREIALTVLTIRLLRRHGKSANVLHGSYNVMEGTSERRRTAPSHTHQARASRAAKR